MSKIYLSSKGIRLDKADNDLIINRAIELSKDKDLLIFPNGQFRIGNTIQVKNKAVRLEGAEDTIIVPGTEADGIRFISNTSYRPEMHRIEFINVYGVQTGNAIVVNTWVTMSHITVRNWSKRGVVISGDVLTGGQNSSASFSRFDSFFISGCGEGGFYFQGGDANQCNIYHCDVRDCNGIAFHDDSFLGNQFFGCEVHNCRGSYAATQASNRAGFYGCYVEQDSGAAQLQGRSNWIGGFPAAGIESGGYSNVNTASFN